MSDHPKVRALHRCPNCRADKPPGLLVCWPCNRGLKRQYEGRYGPAVEALLEEMENA